MRDMKHNLGDGPTCGVGTDRAHAAPPTGSNVVRTVRRTQSGSAPELIYSRGCQID